MPRYVHYTLLGRHRWGRVTADGHSVQGLRGDIFDGDGAPEGEPLPLEMLRFDPPLQPSKIVCVGRNYAAHAAELDHDVPTEPLIFLKPPSALVGHDEPIVYPVGQTELVHHEGELAVVIGRRTRNVRREQALAHVFGYTILNDVTARDLQRRDGQWTRAKGFDTFAPAGPWIDTDFSPRAQRVVVQVNGDKRQDQPISDMLFDIPTLIAHISSVMTLERGDVISTGTPSGVGPLVAGDVVEVHIEGLGTLRNHVVEAAA